LFWSEARLHQLQRGVALPRSSTARIEHADPLNRALFNAALNFSAMMSKAHPATGVNSPFLSYCRSPCASAGEAVGLILKGNSLYAIEAAIDFRLDVAMGRDHAVETCSDHHAAAGAANRHGLVPVQFRWRPAR
jgi:hypothetical protein